MISIQYVKLHPDATPPRQAYDDDAGWDLFALENTRVVTSLPHRPSPPLTWVRTGIALALPTGYYGRIVGRSSAASKGYHVIEGTMDAGYRGEQLMRVCPIWQPNDPKEYRSGIMVVKAGESLAQLVVQKVERVSFEEVEELPGSARGTNGFGSSG